MQHQQHLLQLIHIRSLILFCLCALIVTLTQWLHLQFNGLPLALSLGALVVLNLATWLRLHSPWPVIDAEFFSHLCADAVIYGSLLYQLGGATNPFIFLLLIPLIIAAATLNWRYTLLMTLIVILLYSSLLRHHLPLIEEHSGHQHNLLRLFDWHITGMWINFIMTALVITLFIVRMRQSLDQRDAQLAQEREKRIHDQQLLALATMAAGTAHELGTPLSTLRILLKEMEQEYSQPAALREDIATLQQQVDACSERLQQLTRRIAADTPEQMPADVLMQQLLDEWQLLRPQVSVHLHSPTQLPQLTVDITLRQALLNLLNNAADASDLPLEITLLHQSPWVVIQIHDQGPGLSAAQLNQLGRPFMTTRGGGLGIGLFLTTTTLAQRNGEVRLYNHPQGGTLTEVRLKTDPSGAA